MIRPDRLGDQNDRVADYQYVEIRDVRYREHKDRRAQLLRRVLLRQLLSGEQSRLAKPLRIQQHYLLAKFRGAVIRNLP